MAYLTKFGAYYGIPPQLTGNIYFVAPSAAYTLAGPSGVRSYSASNDNDGLSPERALSTVARAITLATASAGDVIVLLEGTHTVTATVAASKAGLTFVGAGRRRENVAGRVKPPTTLTIRGTGDELLDITASNVAFINLRLQGQPDYSVVSFQTTAALDNIVLVDCMIDTNVNATAGVDTRGIDFFNRAGGQGSGRGGSVGANMATAYLINCYFETNGATGTAIELASVSAEIIGCRFHNSAGTWATPLLVATNVDNTLIDSCVWTTSGTMTLAAAGPRFGYDTGNVDGVTFINNRITANLGTTATAFLGFGTTADLAENYVCSSSASVAGGGTLITRA